MDSATRDRRRAPELMVRLEGYLPASGAHLQLTTARHAVTRAGMREIHAELADIFRTGLMVALDAPHLVALAANEAEVGRVALIAMPGRTGYVTHGAAGEAQAVEMWLVGVIVALRAG